MAPTAKSLILELLVATGDAPLSARLAVTACALFDISENNVRVALVRLAAAGLVEPAGQSTYRLAAGATDLAREVAGWRTAQDRLRTWKGGYVGVHCGALGRTDRGELRRRARALSILGFAELERGLHVRPDNLKGGVEEVRERLYGLGLEREAHVFSAGSFEPALEARARELWDGKALTHSYERTRTEVERWLDRASHLAPDVAARESFLLGGRAIRQIVYDPWLPAPLVDVDERRAFVDATKQMDREGRRIWRRFFEFSEPRASLPRVLEEHAP